jgi:hypothetical protein
MSAPASSPVPPAPAGYNGPREIKLIQHSTLFYWWPVWAFGLFMALWTWTENHRFASLPADAVVAKSADSTSVTITVPMEKATKPVKMATELADAGVSQPKFGTRVSHHAWLGTIYIMILILVIFITNVPLRGLWSFVAIMGVVVLALIITLFHGWDSLFESVADMKVYINLAGYLTLSTAILIIWSVATYIFDRRTYIIFSPGQIKVCEHVGGAVRTYDSVGVTFEKQRDDLFRHYILGFGSGDLIVRTAGAERHEIRLQNVLGIGWKLKPIEDLLREKTTVSPT